MIEQLIKPGDCAWCEVHPSDKLRCQHCKFKFGSDHLQTDGPERFLVLVCYISRQNKSNCPRCGKLNNFPLGTLMRVRRFIPTRILTEQADMPMAWLTKATSEEVSNYFMDDEEGGDDRLRRRYGIDPSETVEEGLRNRFRRLFGRD